MQGPNTADRPLPALAGEFARLREAHGAVAAWALTAFACLLPLWPTLLPLLLVTLVIALIVRHRLWRRKPPGRSPWDAPMGLSAALFMWYVIGLCWTTDFGYGLFDLQIKLPLLVLPLVLLRMPLSARTGGTFLLHAFTAGNALAVVLCLLLVPVHVLGGRGGWATEIFGSPFSAFLHPSYFALYLSLALAVLLLRPPAALHGTVRTLLVGVLVLGTVLCGSKLGWLGLPLVLLGVLAVRWRDRGTRRMVLRLALFSALGGGLLIAASPGVRERVAEAWQAVTAPQKHADAATSSETRKLAWDGATDVIASNLPWGTGTGDVKNELIATYAAKGYVHLVEERLNAHSQFLQTMATLGWPGIVLLVALLASGVIASIRGRDPLGVLFLLLCALNWAVESMLEVQAGVVLFAFVTWALAARNPELRRTHDPVQPSAHR